MDSFGFTKKKFCSLSRENQNRQIITWLTGFYQKLTTNRLSQASLELFALQYNKVLGWAKMDQFKKPESNGTRIWIEAISDQIHFHRSGLGSTSRDYDLLEKVSTNDKCKTCEKKIDFQCHVALDGLRSLFNVGSIFRTCEAAGFTSIILGNTLGQDHPGVKKTAMGAQKWIKQEKTPDLAQTLVEKKEKGFQIMGVETIKGAKPYYDIPWKEKTILVFGNEEYGISSHVMEKCDTFVHIPMYGRKNSLNVANAAAVICFHLANSLHR